VDLDSTPPLDAAVRRAIFAAFEEAGVHTSGTLAYDDAWRRAALREAVEGDEPELGYALSPRSTLGATRA
jgi:hypothetical protein